jgi:hypothetical protein
VYKALVPISPMANWVKLSEVAKRTTQKEHILWRITQLLMSQA